MCLGQRYGFDRKASLAVLRPPLLLNPAFPDIQRRAEVLRLARKVRAHVVSLPPHLYCHPWFSSWKPYRWRSAFTRFRHTAVVPLSNGHHAEGRENTTFKKSVAIFQEPRGSLSACFMLVSLNQMWEKLHSMNNSQLYSWGGPTDDRHSLPVAVEV